MNFSCIKQTEVHNSSLQAAVEFGWMGGALFVLIVVFTGVAILPLARHGGAPLFVLCGLVFVVMLSLAHGRLSRDAVLFALLGTAVGLKETTKSLVLTPSIGR
jgi:O-antigen ligase